MSKYFTVVHQSKFVLLHSIIVLLLLSNTLLSRDRKFEITSIQGSPNSTVRIELSLDDAIGAAGIDIQINYDPQIVKLKTITSGTLGDHYDLDSGGSDGQLLITFTSDEAPSDGGGGDTDTLAPGFGVGGALAFLDFEINSGAIEDLFSSLIIANSELSDEQGVCLNESDDITTENGEVLVTDANFIDNDNDILPDVWEQSFGLSNQQIDTLLDPDEDNIVNLMEYALGLDPNKSSINKLDLPQIHIVSIETEPQVFKDFLEISFKRLKVKKRITYNFETTDNGFSWISGTFNEISAIDNMDGTGTETVTVRDSSPIENFSNRFIRVKVTNE